jgi:hypothetical protein
LMPTKVSVSALGPTPITLVDPPPSKFPDVEYVTFTACATELANSVATSMKAARPDLKPNIYISSDFFQHAKHAWPY